MERTEIERFRERLESLEPTAENLRRVAATLKTTRGKYGKELRNAVKNKNLKEVARLLADGADPNAITIHTEEGYNTALMYAARYCPDAVELLLAAGANPNLRFNGDIPTALMIAVEYHPEVVKILLAAGADPNALCIICETALTIAFKKNPILIKTLLVAGADPNAGDFVEKHNTVTGRKALMYAAMYHPEFVEVLLAFGANPNKSDKYGKTALTYAAEANHMKALLKLTEIADKKLVSKTLEKFPSAVLALLCSSTPLPESVSIIAVEAFDKNPSKTVCAFLSDKKVFAAVDFRRFLDEVSARDIGKIELDSQATRNFADGATRFLEENPGCLDEVLIVLKRCFAESLEKHTEDPQAASSISALVASFAALSGRENECECEVAL